MSNVRYLWSVEMNEHIALGTERKADEFNCSISVGVFRFDKN